MTLIETLRPGAPTKYLITAAYHTPNGPLHLGHLGGPFLSADVLSRHLESLGHEPTRVTGTDAPSLMCSSARTLPARRRVTSPRTIMSPRAERSSYSTCAKTLSST
jgi:methionyl-tRNA synthetase